jgi:hypothetical protein
MRVCEGPAELKAMSGKGSHEKSFRVWQAADRGDLDPRMETIKVTLI